MIAAWSICCAALFAVGAGLSNSFEPGVMALFGTMGAGVGAIAAPALSPRSFRYPLAIQMCAGGIGGAATTAQIWTDPAAIAGGLLLGAMLGAFARVWIEHVQLP